MYMSPCVDFLSLPAILSLMISVAMFIAFFLNIITSIVLINRYPFNPLFVCILSLCALTVRALHPTGQIPPKTRAITLSFEFSLHLVGRYYG